VKKKRAKVYYDKDVTLESIKNKTIAIKELRTNIL